MLPLFKVNPNEKTTEFIVKDFMVKSIVNDCDEVVHNILNRKMSLYVCPFRGFLVVHINEKAIWSEKGRELVVDGVEGRGMYNDEGMASIIYMAKAEQCDSIICAVQNEGVVRLLKRIDFEVLEHQEDGNVYVMRKVL